MTVWELIQNNQTAFLTLLGTLSGAFIAQLFDLISKYIDQRNVLKNKKFDLGVELEKKYLIEPLINFIDNDLRSIQKTFATVFSNEDIEIDNKYVFELTLIKARVDGLGDKILSDKFREFSNCRVAVNTKVYNRQGAIEPFEELNKSISLAADILKILFNKLKSAKN